MLREVGVQERRKRRIAEHHRRLRRLREVRRRSQHRAVGQRQRFAVRFEQQTVQVAVVGKRVAAVFRFRQGGAWVKVAINDDGFVMATGGIVQVRVAKGIEVEPRNML